MKNGTEKCRVLRMLRQVMVSKLQSKNFKLGSVRKGIKKCLKLSLSIIFRVGTI